MDWLNNDHLRDRMFPAGLRCPHTRPPSECYHCTAEHSITRFARGVIRGPPASKSHVSGILASAVLETTTIEQFQCTPWRCFNHFVLPEPPLTALTCHPAVLPVLDKPCLGE